MNFQDIANPAKLKEIQQQVFQDMASRHGLTLEEVQPLLEFYQQQIGEATEKYKRAHQQAVQRLDAFMQRLSAEKKRKAGDP